MNEVNEIKEQIDKNCNEYITNVMIKNRDLNINQIIEIRRAYMAGAIAILTSIKNEIDKKQANDTI